LGCTIWLPNRLKPNFTKIIRLGSLSLLWLFGGGFWLGRLYILVICYACCPTWWINIKLFLLENIGIKGLMKHNFILSTCNLLILGISYSFFQDFYNLHKAYFKQTTLNNKNFQIIQLQNDWLVDLCNHSTYPLNIL
jgi:hypothetical protein